VSGDDHPREKTCGSGLEFERSRQEFVKYIDLPMISPCLLLNVANRELAPEQLEKTKTQELERDPKENQYQRTGGDRCR